MINKKNSSETNIKELWLRLRRNENQEMLRTFEVFIGNVSQEVKRSKNENHMLESVLMK